MQVKQGDTVIIRGNSIFNCMGIFKAQGEVMHVRADGVSFRCKQTNAIETADFADGQWTIITAEFKASLAAERETGAAA